MYMYKYVNPANHEVFSDTFMTNYNPLDSCTYMYMYMYTQTSRTYMYLYMQCISATCDLSDFCLLISGYLYV